MYNYIKKNILINEAEQFTATYEILKNFIVSNNDGWNIVFYKGNKIQVSYKNREVLFFNQNTRNWEKKDLDYKNFLSPENFGKFSQNSKKIINSPEEN